MKYWVETFPKLEWIAYRTLPVVLTILIFHLIWFADCFSLPHVMNSSNSSYYMCLAALIYLQVNFLYSIGTCVWTDPSIRKILLITKVRGDWSYCTICQTLRPPRTHHCHSCGICILRRDHHCSLIGQCIGLANWRYFFNTLTFGFLSSALMTYFNLHLIFGPYVFSNEWSTGFRLLCMLLPPGLFWLLGLLTLWQTMLFVSTSLTLIISCLLLCFAIHQLHLAVRNQTISERTARFESIRSVNDNSAGTSMIERKGFCINWADPSSFGSYDLGLTNNLTQFLGKRWFLAVLFPWFQSELTTDGLNFSKSK